MPFWEALPKLPAALMAFLYLGLGLGRAGAIRAKIGYNIKNPRPT